MRLTASTSYSIKISNAPRKPFSVLTNRLHSEPALSQFSSGCLLTNFIKNESKEASKKCNSISWRTYTLKSNSSLVLAAPSCKVKDHQWTKETTTVRVISKVDNVAATSSSVIIAKSALVASVASSTTVGVVTATATEPSNNAATAMDTAAINSTASRKLPKSRYSSNSSSSRWCSHYFHPLT